MRDLFTGRLSYVELAAFLQHLPTDSALRTSMRDAIPDDVLASMEPDDDAPHGAWSREALLLADVFDALQMLTFVQLKRGGADDVTPPTPLRRPGVVAQRAKANPQALAYLQRIRDLHAQQTETLEAQ